MTTERERILELVASGKLPPAEADRLLRRAEGAPGRTLLAWLLDPIDRLGTRRALLVGLAAVAVGVALGGLGIRFDGALDMHFGGKAIPLGHSLADAAVAWPLTALVFWAVSLGFARQGRLVDHLAVVGLARVPSVLSGAAMGVAGALWPPTPGARLPLSPAMIGVALALFPLVVWQIALLYRGFRTASGLRGVRCVVAAIVAILGAEVVSKVALALFSRFA